MHVSSADIECNVREKYSIIDENGEVVPGRSLPDLADETMVQMYADMAFARYFDTRAVSLQRQGRLGTYPPVAGQEASQVGSTYALADEDWILPTYRENAAALARGVPPSEILRYWMGYEEGNTALTAENIFPYNIVIASLIPHAVGLGMAATYQDTDQVILCHFGDGATSEGDFHEGLNFAGVYETPTVFFCNNNRWAISVPRDQQSASDSIAQKALAYGFDGVRVDGMDPFAVYDATRQAVERAREGGDSGRPTLIESVQYRFGAHTTADDPSTYRDEAQVERWKELDPLDRLETFLLETGRVDRERLDAIEAENRERMDEAIDAAEAGPEPEHDAMFEHVFEEPTAQLDAQCEWLARFREEHGDEVILEE